jgi:group II intron reverse transcriptase/maturase
MMNGDGKSDRPVVPGKSPNKGGRRGTSGYGDPYPGTKVETPDTAKGAPTVTPARERAIAEGMEGRGLAKGNPRQQNTPRTLDRAGVHSALERVRQAARRDRKVRFTALLHHVYDLETLREAYFCLKREAAPGVDRVTWQQYGEALDALYTGLLTKKVNWVLDMDIRGFFDAIDHGWLVKLVEHRIADRRVVRLVQKWLNAGVLEDGMRTRSEQGTPQGGSASPLLANIYLHYVFDLWAQRWRRTQARGDVVVVRYADDIVVGFQYESDAERFRAELAERFSKFALELHPDKTRLIEFGPFAAPDRERRGQGKPETFDFLGFTHICGKKRSNGRFTVLRQTIRKRLQAKLKLVKNELRCRLHEPIPEVGKWLRSVVGGHIRYYGVPSNGRALYHFRFAVGRLWYRSLRRRSQKSRLTWERMRRLIDRWLPPARICHPYPLRRLGVIT